MSIPSDPILILLVNSDREEGERIGRCLAPEAGDPLRYALMRVDELGEAQARLRHGGCGLVLLDASIPETQGTTPLNLLRREFPHVPVVALTSHDDPRDAAVFLKGGAQDMLIKRAFDAALLKRSLAYAIERHHLLERLEQVSEVRFRHMIERSADGMVVVNTRGLVCYLNPAVEAIFERRSADIIGKKFDFNSLARQGPVDGTLDDLSLKYISLLSKTGKTTQLEISLEGDLVKLVEMRATDITWENEPSFLVVFHDITSLMRLSRLKAEVFERERISRLKDEFISTVSHELRTPLAIIKCAVENMKDGITGALNEKQEKVVRIASSNVDRLTRLIDDILDLSRMEAGTVRLEPKPMDVGESVADMVRRFQLLARDHGIEIGEAIAGDLPVVMADVDKVLQVLDNLMSNALRFARARIEVRVRTMAEALAREGEQLAERLKGRAYLSGGVEAVEVSLFDDGPGIPQDKLGYLFNKFVQIDRPSGGSGYMGTGLGLAIAREIVDLHGGVIWAENRMPDGKGAAFHFILPKTHPENDAGTLQSPRQKGEYDGEKTHPLGG